MGIIFRTLYNYEYNENETTLYVYKVPNKNLSKKEQLLMKHGVIEKLETTNEGTMIHLLKDPDATKRQALKIGFDHADAISIAVWLGNYEVHRSFPNESFKDFMIRLGWIEKSDDEKYE